MDTCPGCGFEKLKKWTLCHDCLEEHGADPSGWPEWLQDNARAYWREEKQEQVSSIREVQASDFDLYEGMDGVLDEDLVTRPLDEMAASYGSERIMLPYAPYDNEEDNRAYRRANGIAERD